MGRNQERVVRCREETQRGRGEISRVLLCLLLLSVFVYIENDMDRSRLIINKLIKNTVFFVFLFPCCFILSKRGF